MAEFTEEIDVTEEDKEVCSKPAISRDVKIDELVRLLNIFSKVANKRWPAKPEEVYVDKVVMAIRGCSSVIKARQQAAIEAGVVPGLMETITGCHQKDRETMVRTSQCILGICGKNDEATAAFKEAGAGAAYAAVVAAHEGKDSTTNDMAKCLEMFAEAEAEAEAEAPAVSDDAAVEAVAEGVEKASLGDGADADADEASEEDKEVCSKPAISRDVKIDELVRLLNIFSKVANKRWPAKPEEVYVDKVVMAIRGCSSVIKARQQAAIEAGVVPGLMETITGCHQKDRETMVRTSQCILGICGKNDEATAAFKEAGAGAAYAAVVAAHEGKDSTTNDMAKCLEMFAEAEAEG